MLWNLSTVSVGSGEGVGVLVGAFVGVGVGVFVGVSVGVGTLPQACAAAPPAVNLQICDTL